MTVSIVTTAHWSGDARLNRHATYLERAGVSTELVSFHDRSRLRGVLSALAEMSRTDSDIVLIPDPEMFFIGSALLRIRGKRAVIDIHEDYASAAAGRDWIPGALRPVVRFIARVAVWAGRRAASRVVVAAPELERPGDTVVLNLPEPGPAQPPAPMRPELVYVGDITKQRGALAMVDLLCQAPDGISLVLIGPISDATRELVETKAQQLGLTDRVVLEGRLPHERAWVRARGALAGLSLLEDLPAYRRAIATKLWEYAAEGIPPVVSRLPGQISFVSDIDDQLAVEPSGGGELLQRLLEDSGWRSSIADKAREKVITAWETHRPDLRVQSIVEP